MYKTKQDTILAGRQAGRQVGFDCWSSTDGRFEDIQADFSSVQFEDESRF